MNGRVSAKLLKSRLLRRHVFIYGAGPAITSTEGRGSNRSGLSKRGFQQFSPVVTMQGQTASSTACPAPLPKIPLTSPLAGCQRAETGGRLAHGSRLTVGVKDPGRIKCLA